MIEAATQPHSLQALNPSTVVFRHVCLQPLSKLHSQSPPTPQHCATSHLFFSTGSTASHPLREGGVILHST